jgi:hypothetical protein
MQSLLASHGRRPPSARHAPLPLRHVAPYLLRCDSLPGPARLACNKEDETVRRRMLRHGRPWCHAWKSHAASPWGSAAWFVSPCLTHLVPCDSSFGHCIIISGFCQKMHYVLCCIAWVLWWENCTVRF